MIDESEELKSRDQLVGASRARITEMKDDSRLSDVELEALRIVHPLTRNTVTRLRFNALFDLLFARRDGRNFVLAVTGSDHGVGCSYVALNLAAAIAGELKRTSLLIQCNPHPGPLDRMIVPSTEIGLLDYLRDPDMEVDDIVYSPRMARMRAIPYGSRRLDSTMLGSAKMEHLIDTARVRYTDRFVVLDIGSATDLGHVRSVLEWSDLRIMVVPYGKRGVADAVRPAIDAIGRESLTGLVMNRVPG